MADRKYQFALGLGAFHLKRVDQPQPLPASQSYAPGNLQTLERIDTLPRDTMLFGTAADGLPLLLDLHDPRPGPIMITAEKGAGKTDFLKRLLSIAHLLVQPGEVQFSVLTNYPADFAGVYAPDHLLGVWPAYEQVADELLFQLACRVQKPKKNRPVLLLIDGLDTILQMEPAAQENLAYLLSRGPKALIWPVVTANAEMLASIPAWYAYFHTVIYGRISNPRIVEALTPLPGAPLRSLRPGSEFCLREKSRWLKFWLPSFSN